MKQLSDFKDNIKQCSKCGLCQAVCPVYKETGNECAVSKGKFVMLDGVIKGDLKLNKNINKYLDMCLKCGKCSNFCPSGIDVCKIFESAKYEYTKDTLLGKFIYFLESEYVFGNFIRFLSKLNFKSCRKESVFELSEADIEPFRTKKILYFKGCYSKIFPYTSQILKKLGLNVIEPEFDCCGIPFLSSGNLKRYERVKKHNIEIIQKEDFDYILTDCASCESSLKEYFKGKSEKVNFINLGELAAQLKIKINAIKPVKVTFHKPCHLENASFIKYLFENSKNIEYIEHEGYDDCCGFAGEFGIKNRKISKLISKRKAQNIINTGADYVITMCPSCLLGLKQGLISYKNAPKIIDLSKMIF